MAQAEFAPRARRLAAQIGRKVARGQCPRHEKPVGQLLGTGKPLLQLAAHFAPEPVLDYVVAHEVAHLAEMNHGPRFWRLVESLRRAVPGRGRGSTRRGRLLSYG